jgi:hypothetical protein
MAAPSTPTNFNIQQGNGQVYLSWGLSAGATSYPVYRSTDNVTFTLLATAATNSYLDTAATINTQYYYKVSASNGTESPTTSSLAIIPTMAAVESLGSLRLQAQQRADRVGSEFVTLPEWNLYINKAAQELYDLLVTAYEDYYLAPPYTFQTDGINNTYELPNGVLVGTDSVQTKQFYKLMGVDCGLANNNNARVTVHKYDFIERNRFVYPNITSTFLGVFNMRYRVMGNKLMFIPTPSAGQYITMWYIPRLPTLLQDTDTLDGINGWSEYVVVRAAIMALMKEEQDVSALAQELIFIKQRIEETAVNRDAGQPDTISNTRGWSGRSGQGGGPGWDGGFGGY